MKKTKIEWADVTWNPIVGCNKVSAGCTNCYAATQAKRLAGMGQDKYQGLTDKRGNWTGAIHTDPQALTAPLQWQKPRRVFVNSMGDFFHPKAPRNFQQQCWEIMRRTPKHTYMILTKYDKNMAEFIASQGPDYEAIPSIWLGVSIESGRQAQRAVTLLETKAAIRFVSCEPLIGPLLLQCIPVDDSHYVNAFYGTAWDDENGELCTGPSGEVPMERGLDWVIAGGESGPNARPCHPAWATDLQEQCRLAKVPFFWKQWGEWVPCDQAVGEGRTVTINFPGQTWDPREGRPADALEAIDQGMIRVGKRRAGRVLKGRTWDEFPDPEKAAAASWANADCGIPY